MSPSERPSSEWRSGWKAVVAGFTGYGTGVSLFVMTIGLFIIPMNREFGWPISWLVAGPIASLLGALLAPFVGALIDRFGARPLAIVGFVGYAATLALFAVMPKSLVAYYGLSFLLGVASAPTHAVTFTKALSGWFQSKAGLPMAVILTGVSAIGALAVPTLSWIIAREGWRAGYLALSAITFVGLLVLLWLFREPPAPARAQDAASPSASSASFNEIMASKAFWVLFAACAMAALPIGGFLNHMFAALEKLGLSPATVGSLGGLFAVSVAVGRLASGLLLDLVWPYSVGAAFFALAALGAWLLSLMGADGSIVTMTVAVVLIGMAQGGGANFFAYYLLGLFGRRAYAKAYGVNSMGVSISVAAGGALFGLIADRWGGYEAAIVSSTFAFALAAALMLVLGAISGGPKKAARPDAVPHDGKSAGARSANASA